MAQLFPPSANALARASIVLLLAGGGIAFAGLYVVGNSPYITRVEQARLQPVQFLHRHHVESMGIECRYCHVNAEDNAFAGIPPTHTCMTCHSQIWVDSPMLQPVRDSYLNNKPLEWTRVHDLPDFVYFNHSVHLKKGVSCVSCHGRMDKMATVYKENTLQMGWCLDCHRNPEKHVRPRDEVFNLAWEPPHGQTQEEIGKEYVKKYHVNPPTTDCYGCHR